MSVFSSYGSADLAAGTVGKMRKISDSYGRPFLQSEFGGRVDRASSAPAFTGCTMGVWDSSSRRPTSIMNGFTQA